MRLELSVWLLKTTWSPAQGLELAGRLSPVQHRQVLLPQALRLLSTFMTQAHTWRISMSSSIMQVASFAIFDAALQALRTWMCSAAIRTLWWSKTGAQSTFVTYSQVQVTLVILFCAKWHLRKAELKNYQTRAILSASIVSFNRRFDGRTSPAAAFRASSVAGPDSCICRCTWSYWR